MKLRKFFLQNFNKRLTILAIFAKKFRYFLSYFRPKTGTVNLPKIFLNIETNFFCESFQYFNFFFLHVIIYVQKKFKITIYMLCVLQLLNMVFCVPFILYQVVYQNSFRICVNNIALNNFFNQFKLLKQMFFWLLTSKIFMYLKSITYECFIFNHRCQL